MSKIERTFVELFADEVCQMPDGRMFISDDAGSYPPTYIIDVGKLLSIFCEVDVIRLVVKMQQLIIDFVRENGRPDDIKGYFSEIVYGKIEDVSQFAERLEDCICRSPAMIKLYCEIKSKK